MDYFCVEISSDDLFRLSFSSDDCFGGCSYFDVPAPVCNICPRSIYISAFLPPPQHHPVPSLRCHLRPPPRPLKSSRRPPSPLHTDFVGKVCWCLSIFARYCPIHSLYFRIQARTAYSSHSLILSSASHSCIHQYALKTIVPSPNRRSFFWINSIPIRI